LLEAERPQRSRTRFIGIALAITSHFDDPLENDVEGEWTTLIAASDQLRALRLSWPALAIIGILSTMRLASGSAI